MARSVWELTAEDLSHLGGPMGTEYTTTKSIGLYSSLKAATDAAEIHYASRLHIARKELKWKRIKRSNPALGRKYSSPDLGYVQYHVEERIIQE